MRSIKRLIFTLIFLFFAAPSWAAFPTTAVLDTCVRANEGPPPSSSWVVSFGTGWKIVSNQCVNDSTSNYQGSTWNTSFNAAQEAYATLQDAGDGFTALNFRQVTANDANSDHYEARFFALSGGVNLYKRISGTETLIGATSGGTFSAGDVVGISMGSDNIIHA